MPKKLSPSPQPCFDGTTSPHNPLKKQSCYSGDPWLPGEVPARAFMGVSRPHDQKATPYGLGVMAVEPPKNRGKFPPKVNE